MTAKKMHHLLYSYCNISHQQSSFLLTKLVLAICASSNSVNGLLNYLLTLELAILQSSNDLSVDEICAGAVQAAVMPGCEYLFAEVETPGGMLLLPTLPLHLLLTL